MAIHFAFARAILFKLVHLLAPVKFRMSDAPRPQILIVEDERPILDGLVELFKNQGFDPTFASDGALGLTLARQSPDLAIAVIDWMLPSMDGIDVLRALRADGRTLPILMLTARGAEADVVAGLEAGADDYVSKPFGVHELVARVRGLLRRADAPHRDVRVARFGDVTLDFGALRVRAPAGDVPLTAREAMLLEHLYAHRTRAVPRDELLVEVWGYRDGSIRTRTVDVHVQQLRAKLRHVPAAERWVTTVRGVGYRFDAP